MARAWRRSALAAVAAAILGSACMLSMRAHAAQDEPGDEPAQAAPDAPKSGKRRQDPAEAQRAIETALKQLKSGRPELALQGMTATLAGGNLPPAIMARAFFVRGMAFREQARPAQAISDLNSALWLKGGLGTDDRAGAIKERTAAYADAGLGDSGETAGPAPKSAGGNWLGNLFGGGSSASSGPPPRRPPPAATPPPAPPPPVARSEPPPPPSRAPATTASGWSSTTQEQADRPALAAAAPPPQARPAPRAEPPPPRAAPPGARLEGQYLVQLAAVRTEAEARTLAAKAKREAALAGRELAIDNAVLGNMGTFFRVRFGPFASAQETQAVCAKLQSSGFDCLPVGP